MTFWISSAVGLTIAYLLGATPTGYLAGRLLKGIDIREHGSGSTGATNVLRILGRWAALAVLVVDLLKGAGAILVVRWLCTAPSVTPPAGLEPQALTAWAVCLAGLLAVLGHSRSVWLGFTGGKSAATGLGVLLAMAWPVGLGAAAAFGLALAISRVVSLSSMLGAVSAVVLVFALPQPWSYRLLVLAGAAYVILRHRANIGRLRARTEPRIGGKVAAG